MSQNYVSVLLIEDNLDYAELVQQWLSGGDGSVCFNLSWTDSLAAGLNRLARGKVDVVLLDLGLPDSTGTDTFAKLRQHAPAVPVIILSSGDSESLALNLVRKGAEDYLVKSACNGEALLRALRFALARGQWHAPAHQRPDTRRGRAVGIIGSKGGVGTTTVACSLASELAGLPAQEALLVDLDSGGGMVRFLMNIDPPNSILDAVRKIDQMDMDCWQTIVTRTEPRLNILPLPDDEYGAWNSLGVSRLLEWTQSVYDWVVADLGRICGTALELAGRMDQICLVTTTSIPALFQAKRAAGLLLKAGFAPDRLRIVLNQVAESGLTGSELQKVFGIPVHVRLPADPREMDEAALARRMPNSRTSFGREVGRLARSLAGLREPAQARSAWATLAGRWLNRTAAAERTT